MDAPALYMLIRDWISCGLRGVEAYHPSATRAQARALEAFARRNALLVTGGSDFHGDDGRHMDIGQVLPYWPAAGEDAGRLMERIGAAGSRPQA